MLFLILSCASLLMYLLLKPFSDGLYNTSLWLAKASMDSDSPMSKDAAMFVRVKQGALTKGWPSNIFGIFSPFLILSTIVLAFIYAWWFGLVIIAAIIVLGSLVKILFPGRLTTYLNLFLNQMSNRASDYRKNNDFERAEIADEKCQELREALAIYLNSGIAVPTKTQLDKMEFGDKYSLISP